MTNMRLDVDLAGTLFVLVRVLMIGRRRFRTDGGGHADPRTHASGCGGFRPPPCHPRGELPAG
jgi:hypothetical protein